MRQLPRLLTLSVASLALCSGAFAASTDADKLIEGAKLCTKQIQAYEKQNRIPTHLLSAISSTESGRWNDKLKIVLPWPWTINAAGKGYYFDSKQEAIAAARRIFASGTRSMDVGCMQVNLMHHPDAFRSLEEAFEPQTNVAYGARFLTELYASEGTWKKAAAAYHSKTPARGSEYVGTVFGKWNTIMDRLNLARSVIAAADIPGPAAYTPRNKNNGPLIITPRQLGTTTLSSVPQTKLGEQAGKQFAPQKPVQMKTISVAGATAPSKREKGVVVVRPDVPAQDTTAAITPEEIAALSSSAAKTELKVAEADPQTSRIVRIPQATAPKPAANTTTVRTSGPRFIFDE